MVVNDLDVLENDKREVAGTVLNDVGGDKMEREDQNFHILDRTSGVGLIRAAQDAPRPYVAGDEDTNRTVIQEQLQTSVSIGPAWRDSHAISPPLNFPHPCHQEEHNGSEDLHSTPLESPRDSQIPAHDLALYDTTGDNKGKAEAIRWQPSRVVNGCHEDFSHQSGTLRRLLEQRQLVRNEVWHMRTALNHPGSGVGSSSGYQIDKDPKFYKILNDPQKNFEERDRFFAERRTLLSLIEQEIQTIFESNSQMAQLRIPTSIDC